MPFILQAIQELAAYEKEADAVEATHASLRATIAFSGHETSSSRPAKCLVATRGDGGVPQGIALYFYNYSTWTSRPGIYLEDLYVLESARGKGYGTRLLAALAREVVGMGGGRLDWSVLRWNEPSIKFYERIGAEKMEEWMGCRLSGEGLRRMAERAAA